MIYTIIFEGGAIATLDRVKRICIKGEEIHKWMDLLSMLSLFKITLVDDLLGVQGQFIKFLEENEYDFISDEIEGEDKTTFNIVTKSKAERHFLIDYLEKEVNDSLLLDYKEVKLNE